MIFSLDIETSGLAALDDWCTVVGMMTGYGTMQFSVPAKLWREDPVNAELLTLQNFSAYLDTFLTTFPLAEMITFNGQGFDIPFLKTRFAKHGLPTHNLDLMAANHTDLSLFTYGVMKKYISKDDACHKFCNLYIPRKTEGLYCARIYKFLCVTDDQHYENLQHNCIDLAATLRFREGLAQFSDFNHWLETKGNDAPKGITLAGNAPRGEESVKSAIGMKP